MALVELEPLFIMTQVDCLLDQFQNLKENLFLGGGMINLFCRPFRNAKCACQKFTSGISLQNSPIRRFFFKGFIFHSQQSIALY